MSVELLRRKCPAGAAIAEAVDVIGYRNVRLNRQFVRLEQVVCARGMHVEQRDHGDRGWDFELNVVSQPDQHGSFSTS